MRSEIMYMYLHMYIIQRNVYMWLEKGKNQRMLAKREVSHFQCQKCGKLSRKFFSEGIVTKCVRMKKGMNHFSNHGYDCKVDMIHQERLTKKNWVDVCKTI